MFLQRDWQYPIPLIMLIVGIIVIFLIFCLILICSCIILRKNRVRTNEEIPLRYRNSETEMDNLDHELINLRIYLRSTPFTLDKFCYNIGKTHKKYFLGKNQSTKVTIMMSLYEENTIYKRYITNEDKNTFVSLIKDLQVFF